MFHRYGAILMALAVSACPAVRADTMLHPGDRIDVIVFNHAELSATCTIDASGNISLPVAGSISTRNLGTEALASAISEHLAPYVRDVAVAVKLDAQSANVFVAGGPGGVVPYRPGMTLSSAVAYLQSFGAPQSAGSDSARPASAAFDPFDGPIDFRRVIVLRDGVALPPVDVVRLRESGQSGPVLQPNDTIQLADKPVAVQVVGDVVHPGISYLNSDEPLSRAIAQAGGVSQTARIDRLQLVRGGQTQYVSLGNEVFSEPAASGDRIVVPRATHVDVLGTVVKPGDTMLRGGNTLVTAIYYAGGPAQFANLRAVAVIHDGRKRQYDLGKLEKGGSGDNPELTDGDVVFVPRGSTFQWSDVWSALGALGLFGVHV